MECPLYARLLKSYADVTEAYFEVTNTLSAVTGEPEFSQALTESKRLYAECGVILSSLEHHKDRHHCQEFAEGVRNWSSKGSSYPESTW